MLVSVSKLIDTRASSQHFVIFNYGENIWEARRVSSTYARKMFCLSVNRNFALSFAYIIKIPQIMNRGAGTSAQPLFMLIIINGPSTFRQEKPKFNEQEN